MIRKDLLDFQYYLDRLSKFMKESYGISEQMEIFCNLLNQINTFYDSFYKQLDIFNKSKENEPVKGETLDKIGAIFGCQRKFTIAKHNIINPFLIDSYVDINLTDDEFLFYIKTQIIKQNFDGRRETLQRLYSTYVNNQKVEGILDEYFLYIKGSGSASCYIYWDKNDPSNNLRNLFEEGYLTVESMGIMYTRVVENFNEFAYYYKEGTVATQFNKYAELRYNKLSSQPSTMDDVYTLVAENVTSTWDNTKIYAKIDDDDFVILKYKLAGWEDFTGATLANYKILTLTPASTWEAGTDYYKKEQLGGFYS